jgi:hypothetical protein
MSYKTEFPFFDYDIPNLEGFVDMSWRNDICPKFVRKLNDTQEIVVWVNFADEDRRECGGLQFVVVVQDIDNEEDPFDYACELETNSWDDVLNKISSITQGELV